jgi:hypothetical protein
MSDRRRLVRIVAAVVSAGVALVYLMIGLGVVTVVKTVPEGMDMFQFGVMAAAAYVIGAVLLSAFDNRFLWAVGMLLQFSTISLYFVVSVQRDPPYEVWGILIKVGEVVLLALLTYLTLRAPADRRAMALGATRPS